MGEKVKAEIAELVKCIYTPDQIELENKFFLVLNSLDEFMAKNTISQDMVLKVNEYLVELETAFSKKDYVKMADVLLYKIQKWLDQV